MSASLGLTFALQSQAEGRHRGSGALRRPARKGQPEPARFDPPAAPPGRAGARRASPGPRPALISVFPPPLPPSPRGRPPQPVHLGAGGAGMRRTGGSARRPSPGSRALPRRGLGGLGPAGLSLGLGLGRRPPFRPVPEASPSATGCADAARRRGGGAGRVRRA